MNIRKNKSRLLLQMDVVKQKINKDVVEKSEMLCVPSIFIVLYDYFFNESGNYRYIFGRYFF